VVIFAQVLGLFEKTIKPGSKVRLLGVRAAHLERRSFQRNLLDASEHDRLDRLAKAADAVRDKFGFDSLRPARSIEPDRRAQSKGKD
jgi:hypothetical protein